MFKLTKLHYDWVPLKEKVMRWKLFARKDKSPVYPSFTFEFTADTDIPFGTLQATMQEVLRELERKFNKK